ncbi:ABC transporter ATP-binding protein [Arthrobacter sp. zg-Y1171]|uniref:ABC transporter ATP-binding protein n=1 Tax=Arthrobacter sp. zg-Y1171 TaxID=2964610 RepID=UPI002105A18D|nr:ABC transporter ATP-binding protein [Arthrobacter sp. zg-Y1171]MCQ1996270.1 ABC transporter ATP-binding protein [Arthrobacter sp. zg-Y1171]UWX82680.1 ABC transporter ATP-binding protein [Arthrobacter sp. zg-Y1171]
MNRAAISTPARAPTAPVVLERVSKTYGSGARAVTALHETDLELPKGSFTAVMGPSGSGKSTLLHCAAGLDTPTTGRAILVGHDLSGLSEDALTRLRRERVAFVFQSFNLMPALTAAQNVELPAVLAGRRPVRRLAEDALALVGLSDRSGHRPGELSGGQQQRVAIARALAANSEVLFADEPSGALDSRTAAGVFELLREAVHRQGQTILMTTHDPIAASYADSVIFLFDGRIEEQRGHGSAGEIASALSRLPVTGHGR